MGGNRTGARALGVAATALGVLGAVLVLGSASAGAATGPSVEATLTIPTASDCASQSTGPFKVAISPDGAFTYTTLNGDGRVAKVSNATNTVVATACTGARYPEAVAVSANGAVLYVTNSASNILRILNTADMSTVKDLDVGSAGDGVEVVTVPAALGKVYVFRHTEASLVVVQTSDNTVVKTVSVGTSSGRRAMGIVAKADGTTLYALVNEGIAVIDTTTDTVSATIPMSDAKGIAISPDGSFLYVVGGSSDDTLRRVSTADNSVVATTTIGSGPRSIVITPDGKHALAALNPSNTVVAIDTATNGVTHTINVGSSPYGVAVSPDGLFAFVANWGGGFGDSLSRISLTWPTTLPPTGSSTDVPGVVAVLLVLVGAGLLGFGRMRPRTRIAR